MLFDDKLNKPGEYPPFHKIMPTNLTTGRPQEVLDEFAIFSKVYECAIALHRTAEQIPQHTLNLPEYYEYNNYIYSFHAKTEEIKREI